MKTRIFIRPDNVEFAGRIPGYFRGLRGWVVSIETAKSVIEKKRTVGFLRAVALASHLKDNYPGSVITFTGDLKNVTVIQ